MTVIHHPESAGYHAPGHPESPARVTQTEIALRRGTMVSDWELALPAPDDALLRVHTRAHLDRLALEQDFDPDTAWHKGLPSIARKSAGAALRAMQLARAGTRAFSLMRPPGHHASREQAMGFCYLNNIAIAAFAALAEGVERVAIWDFDAHHGNGTEAVVSGQDSIRFVSVHQFPGFPGTGRVSKGNCLNFPVLPDTSSPEHMAVLLESWEEVLRFKPGLILASAGFDAYHADPITQMSLTRADFRTLGAWLHASPTPSCAVLEGGYSTDLPQLVSEFLDGWING